MDAESLARAILFAGIESNGPVETMIDVVLTTDDESIRVTAVRGEVQVREFDGDAYSEWFEGGDDEAGSGDDSGQYDSHII